MSMVFPSTASRFSCLAGARPVSFVATLLLSFVGSAQFAGSVRAATSTPPAAVPAAATQKDGVPLTLAQVIRACVLSDPVILAALESVEQARADHTTSGLLPNPSLTVSQAMVPFPGSPFDAESNQGGPPQLDIGVSYALGTLIFGTRQAAKQATQLGVEVAVAEHADVARQRMLEAIVAYYEVLEARELLEIGRAEALLLERIRAVTEQRAQAGSMGPLELDQIRVAQFERRRGLLREQAEFDKATSRLRQRLGRATFAERAEAEGTLDVSAPPAPPDVSRALELAEQHRADFLALRQKAARTRAELSQERRAAWPSVSVSAGYTHQFQEQAVGFPDANSWGVGLDLSLPIFDRNQGNIAHARSAARQADLLLLAARIDLRSELEQAIRDYELSYQLFTLEGEQAAVAASAALLETERAYELGGTPLLEALASQAAFRDVLRDHVSVRAGLLRALHRVNAAVGTALLP